MMRNIVLSLFIAALSVSAQPRVTSVVHSADFSATVAPGQLATVFGTGFAPNAESASSAPLPTALQGVMVTVNGRVARLTHAGPTQVNFQVPAATSLGQVSLTVTRAGQTSAAFSFRVAAIAPAVFQYGTNRGVVQNQDYTLNTATNLAAVRSVLIVYLTGIGLTSQAVADGDASPSSPPAVSSANSSATIGGQSARVLFLGLTPGNVGLAQANIEVPSLTGSGDFPLVVEVGGVRSTSVLISIRGNAPQLPGLPEGVTCVSGRVEQVTLSLEKELQGAADEIVIGDAKLCPTCDLRPPLYGPFVKVIDRARKGKLAVDACYDEFGTMNFVRVRR